MKRFVVAILVLMACLSGGGFIVALLAPATGPPFVIAPDTTNITDPLRADGYVDYIAALNRLNSDGVTPENNASVLIWRAFGPSPISVGLRAEYFKQLGIAPLPEAGDYFLSFDADETRRRELAGQSAAQDEGLESNCVDELFALIQGRPWTRDEFPQVAHWLDQYDRQLALIVEASERPFRFDPIAFEPGHELLIHYSYPAMSPYRDAARARFSARAMLRAGEGDIAAAWNDLHAMHRLARLMDGSRLVIDYFVASAIEGSACEAERSLLAGCRLDAAECRLLARGLADLRPLNSVAGPLDVGERWTELDAVATMACKGFSSFDAASAIGSDEKADGPPVALSRWAFDWNEWLRQINGWHDEVVRVARQPNRAKQREAWRNIENEIEAMDAERKDWKSWLTLSPRKKITHVIANATIALLSPAAQSMFDAEHRANAQIALSRLGVALAAYHADSGEYPAELVGLVPDYFPELPLDPFTEKPYRYQRQDNGYVLSCPGPDGILNDATDKADEWSDDIVLRVPAETPAAPK